MKRESNRLIFFGMQVGMVLLLIISAVSLVPLRGARAASWLVTKIADTNDGSCNDDCSLREAIDAAENGDTIRFSIDLVDQTILLGGQDLVIDKDLTIIGLGPTRLAVSGNQLSRVFTIRTGRTVTIQGLTIKDGRLTVALDASGGGGIFNQGDLTLDNVAVTNNRVTDGGGGALGGGIFNDDGNLDVSNSTISNNTVVDSGQGGCFGGGISSSGNTTLYNVTISGNEALDAGNYCFGAGIDHVDGDLEMSFVTIADNSAVANGGQALGGGLSSTFGFITVNNTLFADNTPENCDIYITPASTGYNLEDSDSCELNTSTDQQNINDPKLGPLQDNGGSLLTQALLEDSPAIDRIPNGTNGCQAGVTTDARLAVRAGGDDRGDTACDIGAYEYNSDQQPSAVSVTSVSITQNPDAPLWLVGMAALLVAGGLGWAVFRRRGG
jgi:CSLREA domain-containing protein